MRCGVVSGRQACGCLEDAVEMPGAEACGRGKLGEPRHLVRPLDPMAGLGDGRRMSPPGLRLIGPAAPAWPEARRFGRRRAQVEPHVPRIGPTGGAGRAAVDPGRRDRIAELVVCRPVPRRHGRPARVPLGRWFGSRPCFDARAQSILLRGCHPSGQNLASCGRRRTPALALELPPQQFLRQSGASGLCGETGFEPVPASCSRGGATKSRARSGRGAPPPFALSRDDRLLQQGISNGPEPPMLPMSGGRSASTST